MLVKVFLALGCLSTLALSKGGRSSSGSSYEPGEWFREQFELGTQDGKRLQFLDPEHQNDGLDSTPKQYGRGEWFQEQFELGTQDGKRLQFLDPRDARWAHQNDGLDSSSASSEPSAHTQNCDDQKVDSCEDITKEDVVTSGVSRWDALTPYLPRHLEERVKDFLTERWDQFDGSDKSKGQDITLSNGNKTASSRGYGGTVCAGPWVPREGLATVTVRVDQEGRHGGRLHIGVVTKGYTEWNDSMFLSPHAWYYDSMGAIYHEPEEVREGLAWLTAGSELTVTLDDGTVTFKKGGKSCFGWEDENEVYSFKLPENCGPISLAVTLQHGATVTLGRPSYAKRDGLDSSSASSEPSAHTQNCDDEKVDFCEDITKEDTGVLPRHLEEKVKEFLTERWDQFDGSDKSTGLHITLSNGNKTASAAHSNYGSVRAGPWVDRDHYAAATVRVGKLCLKNTGEWDDTTLRIGVVARSYWLHTRGREARVLVGCEHHAWWYKNDGTIRDAGKIVWDEARDWDEENGFSDSERAFTAGSVITVTLDVGTVTFEKDGKKIYSFELPENCGPISLAVTLNNDASVTLGRRSNPGLPGPE